MSAFFRSFFRCSNNSARTHSNSRTPSVTPTPIPAFAGVLSPADEVDGAPDGDGVAVGVVVGPVEEALIPTLGASANFKTAGLEQQLAASSAPQQNISSVQFWTLVVVLRFYAYSSATTSSSNVGILTSSSTQMPLKQNGLFQVGSLQYSSPVYRFIAPIFPGAGPAYAVRKAYVVSPTVLFGIVGGAAGREGAGDLIAGLHIWPFVESSIGIIARHWNECGRVEWNRELKLANQKMFESFERRGLLICIREVTRYATCFIPCWSS